MGEQAGGECAPFIREQRLRCIEPVAAAVAVPERNVDVAAVSGRVRPRLGSERRGEPARGGDAADRLSGPGSACRPPSSAGACPVVQLLLTGPEFGVVLVDHDPLLFERLDERVPRTPGRPSSRWSRSRGSSRPVRLSPSSSRASVNSFSNPARRECPAGGEGGLHSLEERALAHEALGCRRDRHWSVRTTPVRAARTGGRGTWSRSGRSRSSPTGPMPLNGLEPVERVHRLHREGDARSRCSGAPRARPSAVALARTVPSLPHHRKRTSIRPRSRAVLTMSMAEK